MFDTSHLHPMLVHFPIALIAFGFLAELASLIIKKEVCLPKVSFYLLIFGTLGAILAWSTGTLFTADMSGTAGTVKDTHALFATITLGLLIIASVLRTIMFLNKSGNRKIKWISFAFYTLAAISVSITGFLGGTLVYNYMMPL